MVSISNTEEREQSDKVLLKSRDWACTRLNFLPDNFWGRYRWLNTGIRSQLFKLLAKHILAFNVAELAFCRYFSETLKAALAEPAELYIAHNLQALPIAAKAAAATGALLGFDIEDFHVEEDSTETYDPLLAKLKRYTMSKYIHRCNYTSAPSKEIANRLADIFSITPPTVLYNVFPLTYVSDIKFQNSCSLNSDSISKETDSYTAYWFSQVISLDRGLQDFIRAMSLLHKPVNLHLRGKLTENVKNTLLELATQYGVADALHFHPPIYAEDLVRDAANHDFGLALEQPVSENRLLTVTNKLFVYLLAGNAVVATKTPGQQEVMNSVPEVGVQYEAGNYKSLASQINAVFQNDTLRSIRQSAWNAGQSIFNWDREKEKFLAAIANLT
ncbi:MAG: glycosyltransferase [Phormidesmis sp.]